MKYTLFFKEATPAEYELLGGKGSSLASMSAAEMPVPVGFCVTTLAFAEFLEKSELSKTIIDKANILDPLQNHRITHTYTYTHCC